MKNIGFGTLQVWPWEVGKISPGVDVSKLEDAIIALALLNTDENPQKYKYNSETGKLFNTESGKQFGFTIPATKLKNLTKRWAFFDKSYKIPQIRKDFKKQPSISTSE